MFRIELTLFCLFRSIEKSERLGNVFNRFDKYQNDCLRLTILCMARVSGIQTTTRGKFKKREKFHVNCINSLHMSWWHSGIPRGAYNRSLCITHQFVSFIYNGIASNTFIFLFFHFIY